jgi:hypothetical protein
MPRAKSTPHQYVIPEQRLLRCAREAISVGDALVRARCNRRRRRKIHALRTRWENLSSRVDARLAQPLTLNCGDDIIDAYRLMRRMVASSESP